jgi:predicted metalloprotease with PDZ domain
LWIVPLVGPLSAAEGPPPTITLAVDAREAPRGILHARLTVPVRPGPLTLLYPKWIPGEHGPTGPVQNLTGLKLSVGGREIPWRRDLLDMYAFRCEIPPGASTLEVVLDFVVPQNDSGFTAAASATPELAIISWNQLLLYPQGSDPQKLSMTATLELPAGWRFGTALPVASDAGSTATFQAVPLTTLVDSPVVAGAHFRRLLLNTGAGPVHEVVLVADSDSALETSPEFQWDVTRLVAEAEALFGSRHYDSYHFLVALSDHIAHFGLEHSESSDNRAGEQALSSPASRRSLGGLLAHEYVHSWNGKYRRPAGLLAADLNQPLETDLLWVYEGLTQYLGMVLAARSGMWTPQDVRARLAGIAATLQHRTGRTWRSLSDTAVAAQILYDAGSEWTSWRRGTDFYDEAALIWLEVDVRLRQKSHGRVSLDDFCRLFFGGPAGRSAAMPYTQAELVAALRELMPDDWGGFFTQRLNSTAPEAPLGGVESSGWRLAYRSEMSGNSGGNDSASARADLRYSLGMAMRESGEISDVIADGPAARAGLAPGMHVIAVNNRKYSLALLRQAIRDAEGTEKPMELLVEDREFFSTHRVEYHNGERSPFLERDSARPDLLSQILLPRAH